MSCLLQSILTMIYYIVRTSATCVWPKSCLASCTILQRCQDFDQKQAENEERRM